MGLIQGLWINVRNWKFYAVLKRMALKVATYPGEEMKLDEKCGFHFHLRLT